MLDAIVFLKNNLAEHFVIYFIPLYILGGRPVAVLSAQFLGYRISFILPVVVMLDTLQIPLYYYLYGTISESVLVSKLRKRIIKKEISLKESKVFRWMQLMGMPGVVAITMTPFKGCGMWSGVLLSKLIGLRKHTSYPLLIGGSFLGCVFLFGIGETFLQIKGLFTGL